MLFHVIVNPSGGSGQAIRVWRAVERVARERGMEYSVHFPTDTYLIRDIVHDLTNVPDSADMVYLVIIGGDGTLNVVLNGIVNFSRTAVGLIPAGSGNDFAHSRGLAGSYDQMLAHISDVSRMRALDVGCAVLHTCFDDLGNHLDIPEKSVLFNNAVGLGFDAQVCVTIQHSKLHERLAKVGLAKLAYVGTALPLLRRFQNFSLQIGDARYEDVLFAAIMLEPYEGGGFQFCPSASPYDGVLDSCVAHGLGLADVASLLPKALKGEHVGAEGVEIEQSPSYRLRTDHPVWIQADGEVEYRTDDVSVRVYEKKLNVLGLEKD
ncbi:hypothetical protein B9G54_05105 [Alloscardovia macacae]|uniref:DAGKc domain-containing protein n=1 Tax=Alloscardovia macacae TaxID=1160091 RepID=A0A1Y2SX99_9BIFI|nr:diacylglycerol kinase family protein [Alloscardovia macacae]OTA26363.1 hypothetical protein B9G54_05105 [Alloscardovia macacae]OTA28831.1 hypothetical protein B9T39_05775 [Alloscardovia macacae]